MENISNLTFISDIARILFVATTILGFSLTINGVFNFLSYLNNMDYNFSLSKSISKIISGAIMTGIGYNMSTEPEKTGEFFHKVLTTDLGFKLGIFALITLVLIGIIFSYLHEKENKKNYKKRKELNSLDKKEETIKEEEKQKSIISNF